MVLQTCYVDLIMLLLMDCVCILTFIAVRCSTAERDLGK